ncbi:hypothetical protein GCM10010416_18270 [Streptomyces caniferus]
MWVSETTVKDVAGVLPNRTAPAVARPVPVRVTVVPPAAGPEAGVTDVRTGTEAVVYVNGTPLLVPPGPVTVTCTVPEPGGAVAMICVPETTTNDADTAPNRTTDAPEKPEPDNVTDVPPPDGPDTGLTDVKTGTEAVVYVNGTPLLVPPGPVTVTCTVPEPGGAVAMICVPETTTNDADTAPNRTTDAPEKPEPDNVTDVPPPDGPDTGLTDVNTGAGVAT